MSSPDAAFRPENIGDFDKEELVAVAHHPAGQIAICIERKRTHIIRCKSNLQNIGQTANVCCESFKHIEQLPRHS